MTKYTSENVWISITVKPNGTLIYHLAHRYENPPDFDEDGLPEDLNTSDLDGPWYSYDITEFATLEETIAAALKTQDLCDLNSFRIETVITNTTDS